MTIEKNTKLNIFFKSKIQILMVIFAIIFFVTKDAAMAAAFGGLISAVNTLLVGYHTNNQANKNLKPGQSVGVMVLSVIQRMLILVVMVYLGFEFLLLDKKAMIITMVVGILGFTIDKVREYNGN
ncbi:MAG: ATP synthase subunit I [Gammaproteobacteria bacterium]|jgi:ATP synthase protein I